LLFSSTPSQLYSCRDSRQVSCKNNCGNNVTSPSRAKCKTVEPCGLERRTAESGQAPGCIILQ
jgi:hypothetical protein